VTLREAAEDLRDGAAKLAAAVIAGRLEDAAYDLHAHVKDAVADVERELHAARVTGRK
jgi:hypothetical protein